MFHLKILYIIDLSLKYFIIFLRINRVFFSKRGHLQNCEGEEGASLSGGGGGGLTGGVPTSKPKITRPLYYSGVTCLVQELVIFP